MSSITVTVGWQHALAAMKLPSTGFSAQEVNSANDIQSTISSFHLWHWTLTAGATIATVAGTQDYSMGAADQNKVLSIAVANLLEGSTEQPPLQVSEIMLPRYTTQGQPFCCGLLSQTQIRMYPNPDAVYTFKWTYYARPVIFTTNAGSYDCPDTFSNVIFELNIWKVMQLMDDDRQEKQYEKGIALLSNLRQIEFKTVGRSRV